MSQGTTKGIPIDTNITLSANSDALVSSQKAVKTYIESAVAFNLTNATGLPLSGLVSQSEATIVGRAVGAGAGVPSALTAAQSRAIIGQTVSATVTGAATTSFSVSGIPSATRYLAVAYIKQDAAGTPAFSMYMNGVTTGYTRTYLVVSTTSPSSGGDSFPPTSNSDGAGDYSIMYAMIENVNGRLQITAVSNQIDRSANQANISWTKSTESSLTSITITSSVANLIAVGSYIEVYVLA